MAYLVRGFLPDSSNLMCSSIRVQSNFEQGALHSNVGRENIADREETC